MTDNVNTVRYIHQPLERAAVDKFDCHENELVV